MRTEGLKERYKLTPQMLQYDKLRQFMIPYMNHTNEPNVISNILNTDKYGTRKSKKNNYTVDRSNYNNNGIVFVGGSVCMGWGASSDDTTIPSFTSNFTNKPCLNLGVMAGNSEMEVISALPYTNKGNFFVSVTGNNTLYNQINKEFRGSSLWDDIYEGMMPFNEDIWEELFKHDILFNSYVVRNDVRPLAYFKDSSDKSRFQQEVKARRITRLKRTAGLIERKKASIKDKYLDVEGLAEKAAEIQLRNMLNLHKLSDERCLFVIQPFMFSDQRVLTKEEKILSEEHYKYSNWLSKILLYEWMPKVYRKFCEVLMKKCKNHALDFIDLTHPPEHFWFYSDTSHFTDQGNNYAAKQIAERILVNLNN